MVRSATRTRCGMQIVVHASKCPEKSKAQCTRIAGCSGSSRPKPIRPNIANLDMFTATVARHGISEPRSVNLPKTRRLQKRKIYRQQVAGPKNIKIQMGSASLKRHANLTKKTYAGSSTDRTCQAFSATVPMVMPSTRLTTAATVYQLR